MNRIIAIATTALILTSASSDACGRSSKFTYASETGARAIVIDGLTLKVNGKSFPLEDCSDDKVYCFRSSIGFNPIFPKKCSNERWSPPAEAAMKDVIGYPHSYGAFYVNKDFPNFMYGYEGRYGIKFIYYDDKGFDFRSGDYGMGSIVKYAFFIKARGIMACRKNA